MPMLPNPNAPAVTTPATTTPPSFQQPQSTFPPPANPPSPPKTPQTTSIKVPPAVVIPKNSYVVVVPSNARVAPVPKPLPMPVVQTVRVPTPTVRVPTVTVRTPTVIVRTPSDIRLKRDIVELGELDNGLRLYRYRYLWSDTVYVGVMAQEVAALRPDAVSRGEDGYLRVDYGRLGLEFLTFDEWTTRGGAAFTRD
jgi:hypothetical protein